MGTRKGPVKVGAISHHELPHNCLRLFQLSSEKTIARQGIGEKMSGLLTLAETVPPPWGESWGFSY